MDTLHAHTAGLLADLLAGVPAAHARLGWLLILAGFAGGALLGLGFHRAAFLGGYGSFRRRCLRLGHVACVALGMLHLVVAAGPGWARGPWASPLLAAGSVTMPLACALAAWRPRLRLVFPVPVLLLAGAALLNVLGGTP